VTQNVLLVKLSSLGDVVHSFPALSEAQNHGFRFDWVVEEAFAGLAAQHPAVDRVIPFALRRWRREGLRGLRALWQFRRELAGMRYSRVLDAQGLIKSALVTRSTGAAERFGLASASAREPASARFYTRGFDVSWEMHAIDRLRALFAQTLGYSVDLESSAPSVSAFETQAEAGQPSPVVLIHGTTWPSKEYPEAGWRALVAALLQEGHRVQLLSGSSAEHTRAVRLCGHQTGASAPAPGSLLTACQRISAAGAVIGVDSGLTHLAAVLGRPTVGLYGATDARRTGVRGSNAIDLASNFNCSPCLRRECSYSGPLELLAGEQAQPPCFARLDTHTIIATLGKVMDAAGSGGDR